MDKVAIVGVGQTAFGERRDDTFADLVFEAASAALADAGLGIADIDNIVTTSNDFFDGRTISSMAVGDAAGAAHGEGRSISTVEGDGTFGAFYGLSRILSGAYGTTLVVAHSKGSEGDPLLLTNAYCDPICERSLGLDWISAAGLEARAFLDHFGLGAEDLAAVVAKNRTAGAKNPKAHRRAPLTPEAALASALVAPPLRADDLAPVSDGAAALVLAGASSARRAKAKPVWVAGAAFCADAPLWRRNLWEARALREAAARAYRMAGVTQPARELDLAEVSEEASHQELLWLRELGFPRPERTNLSGGCLSARAWVASGLVRMIEAALQLRGEAANQGPGGRRALAHGQHGLAGQSHCVWILES